MEEQKIGKGFIIITILLLLGLSIYFWIKNNWVETNKCYFDDCHLLGNNKLSENLNDNGFYSFVLEDFHGYLHYGEYTDLKIRVVKDGETFKNFSGTIVLRLVDETGNLLDPDFWTVGNYGFFDFYPEYQGIKNFVNGLKIDKIGNYTLILESLFDEGCSGSFNIVVYDK